MFRLSLILHVFIGSTLAGTGIIALLVMGVTSVPALVGAVVFGFVGAIPISTMIARRMMDTGPSANKTPPE